MVLYHQLEVVRPDDAAVAQPSGLAALRELDES